MNRSIRIEVATYRVKSRLWILPSSLVLSLILVTILDVQAQQRCDVGAPTKTQGSGLIRACLDPLTLHNQVVEVPRNVTRIPGDGLALCKGNADKENNVDIVYILDNSASMSGDAAYEYQGKMYYLNRVFWNDSAIFKSQGFTLCGSVSVPKGAGTQNMPKVCGKTPISQLAIAGDPFQQAPVAIKQAIDFQANLAPWTTAGYYGFSTGSQGNKSSTDALGPLDEPGKLTRIKNKIIADYDWGGTDYINPLTTAKQWMQDFGKADSQVVILVTDGVPTDLSATVDFINNWGTEIPIIGIYLETKAPPTEIVEALKKTGGRFIPIPPDQPNQMKTLIADIIGEILKQDWKPVSAEVRNTSNNITFTIEESGFINQGNGNRLLRFEDVIALQEGDNKIQLKASYHDAINKVDTAINLEFTLRVAGDSATGSPLLANPNLQAFCEDASKLQITDANSIPVDRLSPGENKVGLLLNTSFRPGVEKTVALTTTGDNENVQLMAGAVKTIPRTIVSQAGSEGNGALETQVPSELKAEWINSSDPRDRAAVVVRLLAADRLSVSRVTYLDGEDFADGYVSRIRLEMESRNEIDPNPLMVEHKDIFVLPAGLKLVAVAMDGKNAVILKVQGDKVEAVHERDKIELRVGPSLALPGFPEGGSYPIADGIAPVLRQGTYLMEHVVKGGPLRGDTLRLRFSEAVNLAALQAQPIHGRRYLGGARDYDFQLANPRKLGEDNYFEFDVVRLVTLGGIAVGNPLGSDSIWIAPDNGVTDLRDNEQKLENNAKVRLKVEPPPVMVGVRSLPLDGIARPLDERLREFFNKGGDFIIYNPIKVESGNPEVASVTQVDSELLGMAGGLVIEASAAYHAQVFIFDNLGHFVNRVEYTINEGDFGLLEPGVTPGTRKLTLLWNTRAKSGALAGNGAYIHKVKLELHQAGSTKSSTYLATYGVLRSR